MFRQMILVRVGSMGLIVANSSSLQANKKVFIDIQVSLCFVWPRKCLQSYLCSSNLTRTFFLLLPERDS